MSPFLMYIPLLALLAIIPHCILTLCKLMDRMRGRREYTCNQYSDSLMKQSLQAVKRVILVTWKQVVLIKTPEVMSTSFIRPMRCCASAQELSDMMNVGRALHDAWPLRMMFASDEGLYEFSLCMLHRDTFGSGVQPCFDSSSALLLSHLDAVVCATCFATRTITGFMFEIRNRECHVGL
ncbi:hypothetical protein BDV25DRAFT_137849 [Aspergillus avenaceus]|uniref:Uncharacterized protein n=1 Tax=Aspergillus avenaceus TaxID=36643 RepID=A0A5N6U1Y3_ASPAV|nr:hypothetical protein BDV25DRAFT_137849 [Aspergillus avenaceus]